MQVTRINNSSSIAKYKVELTKPEDFLLSIDQIADKIEPFNFGASLDGTIMDGSKFYLNIYID